MTGSHVLAFAAKEVREALPPIMFFLVSFNIIELTTQLVLADYAARLANFMVATTMALIVGKAVLVANTLPLLRRFDTAPLIWTILFKTIVYWAVVFVARFLEGAIEYWIDAGTLRGLPEYVAVHYPWHRFVAIQIWIFVLFLVYTSVCEVDTRLGGGVLRRMVFARHATEH